MIRWDVKLRRSMVNAGEWDLMEGYLTDEHGNQVSEQEVWLRINNQLTKGYATEFNRFRFYIRFKNPGIYVLQPTIFEMMNGNYKLVIDGPRLPLLVLPRPNDMTKNYEVRFFRKITLDEILPGLKIINAYVKQVYPKVQVYIRSGILRRGYSWHDVDFLVRGANEHQFQHIKNFIKFTLPVNMDVWRYEEYHPNGPRIIVSLDEVV